MILRPARADHILATTNENAFNRITSAHGMFRFVAENKTRATLWKLKLILIVF